MSDFYLKFTDEAEATSVLYTTITEYLYEDRYKQPYPSTVKYTDEMLEDNGASFMGVETTVTPKFANIDVIGTIYNPTGEATTNEDGFEVPVMVALDGYHVNVRVVGSEDALVLTPYAVVPSVPRRIWG